MSKLKKIFICEKCLTTFPKWMGQCTSCQSWNTLHEDVIEVKSKVSKRQASQEMVETKQPKQAVALQDVQSIRKARYSLQDSEFDRVLGGGLVPGSISLIGGHPGIGKSTLLLQIALKIPLRILYVSGEESEEQIKMRAERIGSNNPQLYIYSETNVVKILKEAKRLEVQFIVIDSIQTVHVPHVESIAGSVTQIRESTHLLQTFAKTTQIPVFIIGHINKEGVIAGPKILEHIVDTVLQFEGDNQYRFRILRSIKNRFGSTDQIGIYEMNPSGLSIVKNPSTMLLDDSTINLSGSCIAATVEGARSFLIETQALVTTSVYGTPQRSSTGFDLRRMNMLLAVLEKRCGKRFGQTDVFLNIAGGMKIKDPSIDLAVCAALASSLEDEVITKKFCFTGEVGLSGEVRSVSRIEQRIQEAERLGFTDIFISKNHEKELDINSYTIKIHCIQILPELFERLF